VTYVRTVKTRSGAIAVHIVWSSRRASRRIEHLDSAHNESELEALKAAGRQRLGEGPSMNAPTSPVTENVADLDSGITENEFPNGDDLAIPAPLTCPGCRSFLKGAAPAAAWGGAACSRRGIASLILGAQIFRDVPAAD
jgi:hypothetical protein